MKIKARHNWTLFGFNHSYWIFMLYDKFYSNSVLKYEPTANLIVIFVFGENPGSQNGSEHVKTHMQICIHTDRQRYYMLI